MTKLRSLLALATLVAIAAAPIPPDMLHGLVWRSIGPFRGGRISSASGAIGEPGTFYVGTPAGGVWKTTSAGEVWFPVFDGVPGVSSIGAVAVAPSEANTVYVGTGDQVTGGTINEGNGLYKSIDAGRTWTHMGLDDTKQIPAILVDPRDAGTFLVAAAGNLHTKNNARGIYRSTNGGASFTQTLFVNDSVGVQTLASAYDRPDVVFATTIRHYFAPLPPSGISPAPPPTTPNAPTGTGMYKSIDGGATWKELTGGGLPRFSGRTYLAVAMTTNAQRVYFITNDGLYRSDDGGTTWKQMDASDRRIRNGQGGYNCGLFVDPTDPDVVYTFNTASYKSTDGGNTFTGFRGAPGGDDPQANWIDPTNGKRILLGYDQGAIVTLDGGATWSSWYNQNTEQVYHISTDNTFGYWVYATQQDAGAIRTRSRGNLGAVTPMDWSPVNGWEWGSVIPDPLDANIVYSSGNGINKITFPSEQWISVSPAADPSVRLRTSQSQPLVWAPWDKHELITGFQYVYTTTDGGAHWARISGDLTFPAGVTPLADTVIPPPGAATLGSIEVIAASSIAKGTIWVGTNNGLIKYTRDHGKTWSDASIPKIPYPTRALVEALTLSPTQDGTAYAVIDVLRTGDYAPYVYRTRDFGKTWTLIVNGLPTGEPTGSTLRVVRADPKRAGLLYAGTESGVYVSFNDGDDWQSLSLNLPVTSYRDFTFAGNDLIVGSYGRGIWVLDDAAVLRQMTPAIAAEPVHLFKPDPAVRVRRNVGYNTPFPLEVPHALNPPDGAIIYYWLASRPAGDITMEVMDAKGTVVRHLSSAPITPVKEAAQPPEPNFWIEVPKSMLVAAGTNRMNWDLRTDAPNAFTHTFEINANPYLTPASPLGALVPPGMYTIKLTVNGTAYTQPLTVTNDPRSAASTKDLAAQYALLTDLLNGMRLSWDGYQQAATIRAALDAAKPADSASDLAKAIAVFRAKLDSVGGNENGVRRFGRGPARPAPNFFTVYGNFSGQYGAQENGDLAPTAAMTDGYASACYDLSMTAARWKTLNGADLTTLNAALSAGGAKPIPAATGVTAPKCPAGKAGKAAAARGTGNVPVNANDEEESEEP